LCEYSEDSPRLETENVSGKNIDDAFREIDELRERWNKRLTVKNMALAERYFKGELEVGLVLHVGGRAVVGENLIAVFKREFPFEGGSRNPPSGRVMLRAGRSNIDYEGKSLMSCRDGNKEAVFVGDANSVEAGEFIVASRVRLELSDQFYGVGTCARQATDGTGIKMGLIRTYWERSVVSWRPAVGNNKGACEEIKGGPKIVDTISDHRAPFGGDGLAFAKVIDFVASLRLYLHNDIEGLSAFESEDGSIQVRKMFFGPVNLYADAA
jgi:hypothetical protein